MAVSLPIVSGNASGVDESNLPYEHPLYQRVLHTPGLSIFTASLDRVFEWGLLNSLWVFPLGTSCCAIELMSAAASRVDLDRMGTIVRASPRQSDVMVIAGTITVKMAPRVLSLWEQMPEPKWAIAMGSCAISGDFYRNLYSVVPGIDTVLPVDVYVPGCPPNPEALMHGLLRLQEKVRLRREGKLLQSDHPVSTLDLTRPSVSRVVDRAADDERSARQEAAAMGRTEDWEFGTELAAAEPEPIAASAEDPDFTSLLTTEFGVTELAKDAAPLVAKGHHVSLARRLSSIGYRQLVYVVATHFPAKTGAKATPERFEVACALRKVGPGSKLVSWRISLEPGEAAPSLVDVFAGADWQEREQFDLVGVQFDRHPDLRRIMLPERWEGHPLRKDYAADTACPPWR